MRWGASWFAKGIEGQDWCDLTVWDWQPGPESLGG
jgi:hypothetical protein